MRRYLKSPVPPPSIQLIVDSTGLWSRRLSRQTRGDWFHPVKILIPIAVPTRMPLWESVVDSPFQLVLGKLLASRTQRDSRPPGRGR